MYDEEEKPTGVVAYLLYVRILNSFKVQKNAIFRCIMRKAPYRPTEAYLSYVRVEYKGLVRNEVTE